MLKLNTKISRNDNFNFYTLNIYKHQHTVSDYFKVQVANSPPTFKYKLRQKVYKNVCNMQREGKTAEGHTD